MGADLFSGNETVTNVIISYGIKEIRENAFSSCGSLSNISIPGSVITIGRNAFAISKLEGNITIPSSVMMIGAGAFWGCWYLETINVRGPERDFETYWDIREEDSEAVGDYIPVVWNYNN